MRILLLTTTHTGLSQRAYSELVERGHAVFVQLATTDVAIEAAAAHFQPQLIIALFLKSAIPENILREHTVLSVRPAAGADRGPSSLSGHNSDNLQNWQITVQQAAKENNNGGIWASHTIKMRPVNNSNYYRHHIAQAAIQGIVEAVERLQSKKYTPRPLHASQLQFERHLHSTRL